VVNTLTINAGDGNDRLTIDASMSRRQPAVQGS